MSETIKLTKEQSERLKTALTMLYLDGIDLYKKDCEKLYFSIPEKSYLYNSYLNISNSSDCVKLIEDTLYRRFELNGLGIKVRYTTRKENWTMQKRKERKIQYDENNRTISEIKGFDNCLGMNCYEEKLVNSIVNLFKLVKLEGVKVTNMVSSANNDCITVYLEIPRMSILYEEKKHKEVINADSFAEYIKNQLQKMSKGNFNVNVQYQVIDMYWTKEMRDNKNREILNKSRVYKY